MIKTTHLDQASWDEAFWYAVLTRSRQEKIAASMLESLSIPNFLPLISEKRQWSDRKQAVTVPLFPGYLFVRIPKLREFQLDVLKVPGIVSFIGYHSGPQSIPDAEIDSVRAVVSHRVQCTPCLLPKVGDRVRIFRGALKGIEGILVRSGSKANLVITVETIQQSIAIHVDRLDVELTLSPSPSVISGLAPTFCAEHGS